MEKDAAMKLVSPEVDLLIEYTRRGRGIESTSPEVLQRVRDCYALLEKIEPHMEGRDSSWSLWLKTERGVLEDFGDYEDYLEAEEVTSPEEFESLWRMEYPDELQWRRTSVTRYQDRLFFRFGGKLAFDVNLESGKFLEINIDDDEASKLVTWLLDEISAEVRRFLQDPDVYNRELERNLPLSRRLGRVRRGDLWDSASEARPLYDELGAERLEKFREFALQPDPEATIDQMTLSHFLSCCRICYMACDYKQLDPSMTLRELYQAMADGRDEGLMELPSDDPAAFSGWYRGSRFGGHPWEICRGGNSTHISLYVMESGDGWQLRLAGFSTVRAVETAKMAVALFERDVPFTLEYKEEMLRMVTGEDLLGIVPGDIPLGYNHGSFPKQDRIHSFIHLDIIEEVCEPVPDSITWYPLERLEPARSC